MKHIGLLQALAMSGGDWVIHVLVACSIVSVGVILERAVVFRRRKALPRLPADFLARWRAGDAEPALALVSGHPVERGLAEALVEAARDGEDPAQAAAAAAGAERRLLERRLLVLNTLGNNAPFIGLLGTVLGVIRAFHDLAFSASAGPEVVMQGLSEALVATAIGILVALPCVVAYNVLQKLADERAGDAEALGKRLAAALGRGRA